MDNLEEMDKFLDDLPRQNQKEIKNMTRLFTSNETVIKIFQQTRAHGQMTSQVNSMKHLEKT